MNFDQGRAERQAVGFEIGGVEWRVQDVHPDDVSGFVAKIDESEGQEEMLARYDELIVAHLREDQRDQWRSVRERREDPLTFGDVIAVGRWLLEKQTERPTTASSPSGATRTGVQPGSGDASSRRQVVVAGAS